MRVLVTGSRDWQDWKLVWSELGSLAQPTAPEVLTVVHGDCPTGADRHARQWCEDTAEHLKRLGVNFYEERHPARWNQLGKAAGFRRNAEMVNAGADLCLAFIALCHSSHCPHHQEPHPSHGASHTADLARAAGIETRVWTED